MSSWVHRALRLLLVLWFARVACDLVAHTNSNPRLSPKSLEQYDLFGVWAGISITSCSPLRMTGPWRCGSKADIKLTLIRKPAAPITGIFASVRLNAGRVFEQTGRIVEVPVKGATRLWLRVTMRDHSSCLFDSNLPGVEMGGSYLCFHNMTSAERGRWAVRRSY